MRTLLELFDTFKGHGKKTIFINRTGIRRLIFSYEEVHELALKMAALLATKGVGAGDRVLLWAPNSSWWAISYWGIVIRGAVAVPVDFMSDSERAGTIFKLTEAKVVIQSRYKPEHLDVPNSILAEELQYLLEEQAPLTETARPTANDLAQLIYTSGTTGNPKGVMLTHANLVANMIQINQQVPIITADFNFLSLLPLSHMFEQMGGFFTPLYKGASIIYPRTLKPSAIMEALAEEDIYAMMTVPRLMQLLKTSIEQGLEEKHLRGVAGSLMGFADRVPQSWRKTLFFPVHAKFGRNFKVFVSGGAPLAKEVFYFWSKLGFTLLEGYGLTECSPVLTVNTMERQVPGSVGLPLPGVELMIVEKELLARGPNVFPGYYQNDQATREAFTSEGWFKTGDLGEIGPDGWLTIKGREKELIVTGAGINVYPDELEGLLNSTPGVKESCVIGIDKGGGEEVHAVLLLDGSGRNPEQVIAETNQRLDALHRISSFSVWAEPEFPKTTTLKIRKFQVKEQLKKGQQTGQGDVSKDSLINLLARITGTSAAEIHEESRLVADLGLSSIDRLELVNHLEQEFRLDIEDSQIGEETRVGDLRQIITKREKLTGRDHFRFWTNTGRVRALRRVWDNIFHFPLLRIFVELEIKGAEHVEHLEGPVFFVANHLSYLDQPVIMRAMPPEVRYHTATAAWAEFFFGDFKKLSERVWRRFTYEYGTWFVNLFPLPQRQGFSRSFRFMGRLADNRINIMIFPEGQHSREGKLLPFQLGLGVMVKELGIPVVPIRISGTDFVLPHDITWPKRGKVTVRFGPPLRFRFEEPAEIVEKTRQAVDQL